MSTSLPIPRQPTTRYCALMKVSRVAGAGDKIHDRVTVVSIVDPDLKKLAASGQSLSITQRNYNVHTRTVICWLSIYHLPWQSAQLWSPLKGFCLWYPRKKSGWASKAFIYSHVPHESFHAHVCVIVEKQTTSLGEHFQKSRQKNEDGVASPCPWLHIFTLIGDLIG